PEPAVGAGGLADQVLQRLRHRAVVELVVLDLLRHRLHLRLGQVPLGAVGAAEDAVGDDAADDGDDRHHDQDFHQREAGAARAAGSMGLHGSHPTTVLRSRIGRRMASTIRAITPAMMMVTNGTSADSTRSSALRTSTSKVSATLSSMVSSSPDSSPTCTICRARRGNSLLRASDTARPPPVFTSLVASSTASASAVFPITFFEMVREVNNGTPFLARVPRVRVSRAVSSLATR